MRVMLCASSRLSLLACICVAGCDKKEPETPDPGNPSGRRARVARRSPRLDAAGGRRHRGRVVSICALHRRQPERRSPARTAADGRRCRIRLQRRAADASAPARTRSSSRRSSSMDPPRSRARVRRRFAWSSPAGTIERSRRLVRLVRHRGAGAVESGAGRRRPASFLRISRSRRTARSSSPSAAASCASFRDGVLVETPALDLSREITRPKAGFSRLRWIRSSTRTG